MVRNRILALRRTVWLGVVCARAFATSFASACREWATGKLRPKEAILFLLMFATCKILEIFQKDLPEIAVYLARGPEGIIRIGLEPSRWFLWIALEGGKAYGGTPPEPGSARAEILFRDAGVALGVLRQKSDAQAAIGLGQIRIVGFLPLVEKLEGTLELLRRGIFRAEAGKDGSQEEAIEKA
ncbi:exported hypothetical protein [Candidatus Methylacidithermus pantelleriae]|uniref:SCP2 domain-containing protein n=1 Tax=Candidatus Methylacidithermus pantelleriae TaxID=2744239 RepID=A0A8J2BMZ3_9BACT|nr:exported hypothetical protein [Candidatus Methylacidithermus pantelleriae]